MHRSGLIVDLVVYYPSHLRLPLPTKKLNDDFLIRFRLAARAMRGPYATTCYTPPATTATGAAASGATTYHGCFVLMPEKESPRI